MLVNLKSQHLQCCEEIEGSCLLIGVVSGYDLLVVGNWGKSTQEINNPCQLERASFKKKGNSLHYREQILYIARDMHILVTA